MLTIIDLRDSFEDINITINIKWAHKNNKFYLFCFFLFFVLQISSGADFAALSFSVTTVKETKHLRQRDASAYGTLCPVQRYAGNCHQC